MLVKKGKVTTELPQRKASPTRDNLAHIIAPMQRSGTNYLYQLLKIHPKVKNLDDLSYPPEDFLLSYSKLITDYSTQLGNLWHYWVNDEHQTQEFINRMNASLGMGISRFYDPDDEKVVVLKTPDSLGIKNFFRLFPDHRVIILVRDGRDTVESYMKSWGGRVNFKKLSIRWNDRAQKILNFLNEAKRKGYEDQILLVDYNDLNKHTRKTITRILEFLKLNIEEYDFNKMQNSPVLGSSELRGGKEKVNWEPQEKPSNFNYGPKWANWNNREKRKFKKYAGQSLIELGYEPNNDW